MTARSVQTIPGAAKVISGQQTSLSVAAESFKIEIWAAAVFKDLSEDQFMAAYLSEANSEQLCGNALIWAQSVATLEALLVAADPSLG